MPIVKERSATSVHFAGNQGFRKRVLERVEASLRERGRPSRDLPAMYVKTVLVFAWWLTTYLLILLGGFSMPVNLLLCVVLALSMAGIGFNVMHDANHGGYSRHAAVNRALSFSAELIGISSFRWRTKHNVWHHTYTNIAGLDDDVETFGTMRLTPREPWRPLHRFQTLYFPVVYSFIGLDFILRDFMMVLLGKTDEHHTYPAMSRSEKAVFWLGKLVFFTLMIGLPSLVFPWWQAVLGFFFVALTVGLVIGVVFQLAHIMEAADFPEPVGDPLRIEKEWAIHEVETTVNFAPNNRLLNWYVGGLNFQIEHHLLPRICHLNYRGIAPEVRATCEEFGVRYSSYDSFVGAFVAHVRALHRLGKAPQQEAT